MPSRVSRPAPVELLLERWESIDFARIESALTALEAALGEPKLERRLARLVRHARRVLGSS